MIAKESTRVDDSHFNFTLRRTDKDGIERDFSFVYGPVHFGEGDYIDRWRIKWIIPEDTESHKSFLATFASSGEAQIYLDLWCRGELARWRQQGA